MTLDEQIEFWEKECRKMSESDKEGLSCIDVMKPYSRLYHLYVLKSEILIAREKENDKKQML